MTAACILWTIPLLAGPAAALAQTPTEIEVRHRAGQTFVTWRELAGAGKRYRVYRAQTPLAKGKDLSAADFLGELDDRSSRNQGRSLATGVEHAWIIEPGGAELAADQGLFVHTVEHAAPRAYYAVTSVQGGSEERTLVPGANATTAPLGEAPATPQPVLQASSATSELWGHWVGDRDTPFLPALSPWPSRGHDILVLPGTASGPHGLVVRLHAAGQSYDQGWPQRFEVPQDVDILAPSDLQPYTGWSFWFGAQEDLPAAATSDTRVWDYTLRRVLLTVDWLAKRSGASHDPERVYAIGGSMGAIGAMYLVSEAPGRFAAALCRNGLYDLMATDYRNPALFETLLGPFALGLPMRGGLPVLQRTNAAFMANLDPSVDWPVIRTINGRYDETVGWMSAVELFQGLARARRPAVHYFDAREHSPIGYWKDVERALLTRTFQTRRDRPSLRFLDCTLDDDPGDGQRDVGDPIGTLNGYLDYDPRTALATATALDFEVYLRDQGTLDDAPEGCGWCALSPHRTAPFAPLPGEAVHYTLRADGILVDEHLLFADEHGRVQTPAVPLERTRRAARFERGTPATRAPLFLGGAPIPGDDLQVVLRGEPGERWTLFLAPGSADRPLGRRLGGALAVLRGVLDGRGLADLAFELPGSLPPGIHLWARARIGLRFTPAVAVEVQGWKGTAPGHARVR